MSKLITISDLSKLLNLIDPKTKKPKNHILRYWEREFKEIRPKKIKNRRYYTSRQIDIIKRIKFLLKNKGLTINGVKKIISSNRIKLDVYNIDSLKTDYDSSFLKEKSASLLKKVNRLKNYGKKNPS